MHVQDSSQLSVAPTEVAAAAGATVSAKLQRILVQFSTPQMTRNGGFSCRRHRSCALPGSHRSAVRSVLSSVLQSQTIPEE